MSWERFFRRREIDDECAQELEAHLALETEENIARGMMPEEARYAAHRKLGNATLIREEIYHRNTLGWLDALWQDFRFAVRMLRKNPGFTAAAVLTLALGIGANTAIFSLINAVMLRTIPVSEPSQLVVLRWAAHKDPTKSSGSSFGDCDWRDAEKHPGGCSLPYPFFEEVRGETNLFRGAAAFAGPVPLVLSGDGVARTAQGAVISGDYFSTLGVQAVAGRTLGPADDSPGAAPAVVLSYSYWKTAFAGDPAAIGRTILLNRVPFAIVGVTDPGFTHLTPGKTQELFLTLSMLPRLNFPWGNDQKLRSPTNWWLVVMARLRPEVTPSQAQAAVSLAFRNEMLHGAKPAWKEADDPKITLIAAQQALSGQRIRFSEPLYVLMGAVGLVLLIACANVAGLLLARAAAREKEIGVRLALGAGRARIVGQLLTESVTLSLAGGALGVLFAVWGVRVMTSPAVLANPDHPFPFAVAPDWRALAFTLVITLLTGVLFGLAPALRSMRFSLASGDKDNAPVLPSAGMHPGRPWRLDKALVVVQVGLSMIVLAGAGLMLRTLQNLHSINPGFDTRNVLLFDVNPTLQRYTDAQIQNLYRNVQDNLAALPGVISASYSSNALLSGALWISSVHIEGAPGKKEEQVDMLAAGPGFLATLRIPVLAGRAFIREDFEQAAQATAAKNSAHPTASSYGASPAPKTSVNPPIPALVNATFARRFFPKQNPLGRLVVRGDGEHNSGDSPEKRWEIVGVVGDTKYSDMRREIHPALFVPLTSGEASFEVRTAIDPSALAGEVRNLMMRLDSSVPITVVRTQKESIDGLLTQERVIARLASFFGLLALLLACVGLYGLLSYEVARRTREIGIRLSLGAQGRDMTRLIVMGGTKLTAAGVCIGLLGGLMLTRLLSSLLYGVKPTDWTTYLMVTALLAVVALFASYLPARRATKVDPMVALRCE